MPGRHVPFFRYGINRLALDGAARLVTVEALGSCFELWPAIKFIVTTCMSSQIEISLGDFSYKIVMRLLYDKNLLLLIT